MSIKHPITKAEQMRYPVLCDPMDQEWAESLKKNNVWWAAEANSVKSANETEAAKMKKMLVLRDRLLTFGGHVACLPLVEEDYDNIMQRGQFFYGKGVKFRKGRPSQCHMNSALLWDANRGRCQIATGYALSQDGCWRQHSWVVQPMTRKYRIWETTTRRVAYFGFVMTEKESEEFYYWNT